MGNLKAKTLIEKHGFRDIDKGSPKHDKIQLWVYENSHRIIDELFVKKSQNFEIKEKRMEYEIIEHYNSYGTPRKQIIGFVDLYVSYLRENDRVENKFPCVYFEIKTEIPSLGELIRQLNFYKVYIGENSPIVVVSPDDRYEKYIIEQGFSFYKYQDPELLF